jgi:hypothetical protein
VGHGRWCSIVKQTTALNDPAPKAMLVASPVTTRTERS